MKIPIYISALSILLCLGSCRKDTVKEQVPSLITVTSGKNESQARLEYDSQNRITNIIYNYNSEAAKMQLSYNDLDDVAQVIYPVFHSTDTVKYTRNANTIEAVQFGSSRYVLSVDNQNRLTESTLYFGDAVNTKFEFGYKIDGNLDYTRTTFLGFPDGFAIASVIPEEFDHFKSPFYACETSKWWITLDMMPFDGMNTLNSPNNPLKMKYEITDTAEGNTTTYFFYRNFTHEYDDRGYVTKTTVTDEKDQVLHVVNYTYMDVN